MDKDTAKILSELQEIKAMLGQLGPIRVAPTVEMEISACRAQGIDIATYFKAKGAAAPRRPSKRKNTGAI